MFQRSENVQTTAAQFSRVRVLQVITRFWKQTSSVHILTTNKTIFKVVLLKTEHCPANRHPWWVEGNKMISLTDKRQQNIEFNILYANFDSVILSDNVSINYWPGDMMCIHLSILLIHKESVLNLSVSGFWS